jgi:O-acetyl-ADP-ribose deacetylase (regulator of RNase III)
MQAGDIGYVRVRVIVAASDAFQVLIDDGVALALTVWVPARECARHEDIGELRPPRHANPRHIER